MKLSKKQLYGLFNTLFGKIVKLYSLDVIHPNTILDQRLFKPLIAFEGDKNFCIMPIEKLKFNGEMVEIRRPNQISINLSIAKKAREKALNIHLNISNEKDDVKIEGLFYDLIEEMQKAVTFSCSALETFANYSIPEGYEVKYKRKKDKIENQYTKEKIGWLSLEEKLFDIMPDIYEVPKCTEQLRNDIGELIKIRNMIIHNKGNQYEELYNRLIDRNAFQITNASVEILKHFMVTSGSIISAIEPIGLTPVKIDRYVKIPIPISRFIQREN